MEAAGAFRLGSDGLLDAMSVSYSIVAHYMTSRAFEAEGGQQRGSRKSSDQKAMAESVDGFQDTVMLPFAAPGQPPC